jgi:hypothetical protein
MLLFLSFTYSFPFLSFAFFLSSIYFTQYSYFFSSFPYFFCFLSLVSWLEGYPPSLVFLEKLRVCFEQPGACNTHTHTHNRFFDLPCETPKNREKWCVKRTGGRGREKGREKRPCVGSLGKCKYCRPHTQKYPRDFSGTFGANFPHKKPFVCFQFIIK